MYTCALAHICVYTCVYDEEMEIKLSTGTKKINGKKGARKSPFSWKMGTYYTYVTVFI